MDSTEDAPNSEQRVQGTQDSTNPEAFQERQKYQRMWLTGGSLQQRHDFLELLHLGEVQRSLALSVVQRAVRAALQQQLHNGGASVVSGIVQSGRFAGASGLVDVSTSVQQK